MPQLKIMNWNIQNFGESKTEKASVLDMIAGIVVGNQIDIFIVLELNTANAGTVTETLTTLAQILNDRAGGGTLYTTIILSPGTGVEFYGFIVRDTAAVQPVTLTGGSLSPEADLGARTFTVRNGASTVTNLGTGSDYFPLIVPAYVMPNQHNPAQWPGPRKPCMALFKITFPGNNPQYVPIIAAHTRPGLMGQSPAWQIATVPFTYAVYRSAQRANPAPPPAVVGPDLTLDVGGPRAVGNVIVTGDFNVDYGDVRQRGYYNPLINTGTAANDFTVVNTALGTHLKTLDEYRGDNQFANANFDNFFIRGAQLTGNLHGVSVVDLPALFRDGALDGQTLARYYEVRETRMVRLNTARKMISSLIADGLPAGFKKNNYKTLKALLVDALGNTKIRFKAAKGPGIFVALVSRVIGRAMSGRKKPLSPVEANALEDNFVRALIPIITEGEKAALGVSDGILSVIEGRRPDNRQSLLLARIISDHLPVIMTLNVN